MVNENIQTSPEATAPTDLSSVILEVKQLNELLGGILQSETTVDQANFQRTVYGFDDGHLKIVFRGREELPNISSLSPVTTIGIVSPKERPLHTSGDDFGEWSATTAGDELFSDPFERATESGSSEVLLYANATPLGLVQCASKLVEAGIDSADEANLKSLASRIEKREINDEVIALYDAIVAATLIEDDGSPARTDYINEDGLMQVALMLAGNEDAKKLIDAKKTVLTALDEEKSIADAKYRTNGERDEAYKQPGEKLSEDELELLAGKHFVAVHTTPVMPYFVNEAGSGVSVMRPTAEFGGADSERFPRNTMHFSLNHPVKSHMMGNFSHRPVTVVTPVEGLARMNGAPAVLYGVDTYIASNPGEGVLLPEETTYIHFVDAEPTEPFIHVNGNVIQIRSGEITHSDLLEYATLLKQMQNRSLSDEPAIDMIAQSDEFRSIYYDSEAQTDGEIEYADSLERVEIVESSRDFYKLTKPFLPTSDRVSVHEYWSATRKAVEQLFHTPGLIEQHPKVHGLVREAMRIALVESVITTRFGGKLVESDGQSAYIEDRVFAADVNAVATVVGIRSGLHDSNVESSLEYYANRALNEAGKTARLPSGHKAESHKASFDWAKYDSGMIWATLQSAPWQTRRTAVDTGILSFSHETVSPSQKSNSPI